MKRSGEICLIEDYDVTNGEYQLARGIFDTVPRAWSLDSQIYFFTTNDRLLDFNHAFIGNVIPYRMDMLTTLGRYSANRTDYTYTATNRAERPSRPANVTIDGIRGYEHNVNGDFNIRWNNRNRFNRRAVNTGLG